MQKFYGLIFLFFSSVAAADRGVVIREDVCGSSNIIIETSDYWYIAAEWYGGQEFYEGTTVYGNLKTYGFEDLTDSSGNSGRYYIEDWESSLESAYEEHCD